MNFDGKTSILKVLYSIRFSFRFFRMKRQKCSSVPVLVMLCFFVVLVRATNETKPENPVAEIEASVADDSAIEDAGELMSRIFYNNGKFIFFLY